jgi:hypothetical protein
MPRPDPESFIAALPWQRGGRQSIAAVRPDEISGWREPRIPLKDAVQIAAGSELDEQFGEGRSASE